VKSENLEGRVGARQNSELFIQKTLPGAGRLAVGKLWRGVGNVRAKKRSITAGGLTYLSGGCLCKKNSRRREKLSVKINKVSKSGFGGCSVEGDVRSKAR